jgi:hypothetical protein
MPLHPQAASAAQDPAKTRSAWGRYFALISVLNLYLLHLAFRRWHYVAPPLTHDMAGVFFWAVAVNVGFGLLIGWFAIREQWETRLPVVLKLDALIGLLPFLMGKFFIGTSEPRFRIFGGIYTVFLLLRVVLSLSWAAWSLPGSKLVRHASLYVFLATFLVLAGFVPWIWLTPPLEGDEPAYMLLAHSLAFDHDFAVGDNYRNYDFAEQFPPPSPGALRGVPYELMLKPGLSVIEHEPHVITNYRGQKMLWHDVGLPLLIAPAYYFAKRHGALLMLALLGALGLAAIYEIAMWLGATNLQALLTAGIFGFTSPFYLYAQTVCVEAPGAVGILWATLQFFRYRERPRNRYLLLAGICIAALPWLVIRFWALAGPLFLVLSAWVILQEWPRWKPILAKMALLGVPSLVSLGVFAILDKHLFDTYLPNAGILILGRIMPQFGGHPVLGFLGLMFDQSFGLIPTAPMFVAVIAGVVVLFRCDRWGFAALFLPALGYIPFVARSRFWAGGWNPPARYLVAVVMVMVPAASLVLTRKTRWIVAALTTWSGLLTVAYTVNPYWRMPSLWHLYRKSMLVEILHDHMHPHPHFYSALSIFPDCLSVGLSDWVLAWIWLAVVAIAAWYWAGTAKRNRVT